jgi:hypothetical protein
MIQQRHGGPTAATLKNIGRGQCHQHYPRFSTGAAAVFMKRDLRLLLVHSPSSDAHPWIATRHVPTTNTVARRTVSGALLVATSTHPFDTIKTCMQGRY